MKIYFEKTNLNKCGMQHKKGRKHASFFYAGEITKNIDLYTPLEYNTINKR